MIVTTPDSPLAFTMIRPVTPSATRLAIHEEPAEATAYRFVRRALIFGLAGATVLLAVLAL